MFYNTVTSSTFIDRTFGLARLFPRLGMSACYSAAKASCGDTPWILTGQLRIFFYIIYTPYSFGFYLPLILENIAPRYTKLKSIFRPCLCLFSKCFRCILGDGHTRVIGFCNFHPLKAESYYLFNNYIIYLTKVVSALVSGCVRETSYRVWIQNNARDSSSLRQSGESMSTERILSGWLRKNLLVNGHLMCSRHLSARQPVHFGILRRLEISSSLVACWKFSSLILSTESSVMSSAGPKVFK